MNTPSKVKLEPVYLDDLNTQSKDYKVRVTVAEKGRPQSSPKKPGVIFQTIILEDEKSVAVEDNEPDAQIPASMVPMTCTTNTEQPYAPPYAATSKAHGKEPVVSEPDISANFDTRSTAAFDEAFAEAMQFQEIRLASQAFNTDCFEIPDQPASKGIIISESPASTDELPTWAKLSRPRSNSKNKEPMNADMDMDTEDEDHAPRKKLRTALFKDNAEQDIADNKNSTTPSLSDA